MTPAAWSSSSWKVFCLLSLSSQHTANSLRKLEDWIWLFDSISTYFVAHYLLQ